MIGVVVGWFVPGAGSTVTPSLSPATRPEATTGAVCPDLAAGSRPADTVLVLPITQSWYTFPAGSAGSPEVVTISWCLTEASRTTATPPVVDRWDRTLTCGAAMMAASSWFWLRAWSSSCMVRASMAARLWLWDRAWLSSCCVWAWAKPNSTAMTIPAVATAPDSHGTHGTQVRVRFGRAWVLISGGTWRVRATAARTSARIAGGGSRSEEHTSELQSQFHLVCR